MSFRATEHQVFIGLTLIYTFYLIATVTEKVKGMSQIPVGIRCSADEVCSKLLQESELKHTGSHKFYLRRPKVSATDMYPEKPQSEHQSISQSGVT